MSAVAVLAGLVVALAVCAAAAGAGRCGHRVAGLRAPTPGPARRARPSEPLAGALLSADRALALVGHELRHRTRRPGDPVADQVLGRAIGAGVCLAMLHPLVGLAAGVALWSAPVVRSRRRAAAVRGAVVRDLPDLVDLFQVAVGAGANVAQAVDLVGRRCDGPLGDALAEVRRTTSLGRSLGESLEAAYVLGDPVRPLISALVSAERDGAAVVEPLRAVADDARAARRRAAEERARRLPVLLLFPLVLCILPAFGLLTVVPVLAGILRSFEL